MIGLDSLLASGLKIIEKVIPDPQAKVAAELELFKLKQAGEFKELEMQFQIIQNQAELNKLEAASGNVFIAGWRPAAGWICVVGLGYQFLLRPMLIGFFSYPMPGIEDVLMELLFALLGLGGLRTAEKFKRVAR